MSKLIKATNIGGGNIRLRYTELWIFIQIPIFLNVDIIKPMKFG